MPIRFGFFVWMVLALSAVTIGACDLLAPDGEQEPTYIVESYLYAGEELSPVRLTQNKPLEDDFEYSEVMVEDAEITVSLMEGDDVQERYEFTRAVGDGGKYVPDYDENNIPVVKPLERYRLDVRLEDADRIVEMRAYTTVPDTFSLLNASADTVVFQQSDQVKFDLTASEYPGRDQAYYVITNTAMSSELDPERLTPLVRRFVDEDRPENLEQLRTRSSPIINEESYDVNPDGTRTVRFPWLAVAFFGDNLVRVQALDDNAYDFFRSHQAQTGGSRLSPGEIPNIIDHVEGGSGIFGSMARVSHEVYIREPE